MTVRFGASALLSLWLSAVSAAADQTQNFKSSNPAPIHIIRDVMEIPLFHWTVRQGAENLQTRKHIQQNSEQ